VEVACQKLVLLAQRHGLSQRQTYEREGLRLSWQAGRYTHSLADALDRALVCLDPGAAAGAVPTSSTFRSFGSLAKSQKFRDD
jgi:hypothetical protein